MANEYGTDADRERRLEASVLLNKFSRLSPKNGRQLNALLTRIVRDADAEIRRLRSELNVARHYVKGE